MIGLHHYDHVHTNPSVQRTSQSLSCVGSPSKWDISSQILRFPGFCPFPLISAGCSRLNVGRALSDHGPLAVVHQLKMKMLGSTDFCWLLKVGRWARIERPQPLAVVQRSPAENEKCSVPDVAHATRQTPTTVFLFFF